MYDYKTLCKIIRTLGLLFALALVILVVTLLPIGAFGWVSVLLMAVVGVYLVSIPLKLIGEMKEMEAIIESYKRGAKQQGGASKN